MTAIESGIYRHWKGGLYEVLLHLTVQAGSPGVIHRPLFHALDATTGPAKGRRLAVSATPGLAVVAYPVNVSPIAPKVGDHDPAGIPAVAYVGLTLDGARPGPRMRVRTDRDFTAWVTDAAGTLGLRFEYVGPELTAELRDEAPAWAAAP